MPVHGAAIHFYLEVLNLAPIHPDIQFVENHTRCLAGMAADAVVLVVIKRLLVSHIRLSYGSGYALATWTKFVLRVAPPFMSAFSSRASLLIVFPPVSFSQ